MNFQGKAVLVYLEEDNIARAYFRIQPLMTQDGPVGPVVTAFPDDGFLRIVPDKNEQHTFKERMRTLCGLCLMDLRFLPAEANKIRTNKNYSPARGETNQFIVYSDAVRALPNDLIYQVVAENAVSQAQTPFVYIRNGANIQGPFSRADGQSVGETAQLPPDSPEIHAVTVGDQELLFYWPRKAEPAQPEEAPAPQQAEQPEEKAPQAEQPAPAEPANAFEQIQSLNTELSENANRLNEPAAPSVADYAEDEPRKPLMGTRLYQAPQRAAAPRRAHNSLMEAVEQQRYAARYEAPGAVLPQSAELKEVANPADALKRALQGLWQSPESQRQAVDVLLAQPGMRPLLSKALLRDTDDLTLAAMHGQLQELEAERLMTLMQLDDVKKNLAALREEAVGDLTKGEQKKLDELKTAQQKAQETLDQLNASLAPLEAKREEAAEALRRMQGALESGPDFICPPVGGDETKEELIDRVEKSLKAAGFDLEPGDAQAMLVSFALTEPDQKWEFRAGSCADAWLGLTAFAAALGTRAMVCGGDGVVIPGGNAPVFVQGWEVDHPLVTNVALDVLGHVEADDGAWVTPHAAIPLYAGAEALPRPLPACMAVKKECIVKEMLRDAAVSQQAEAVLLSLRKALAGIGKPLPLAAARMMSRFIAAVQDDVKGGVAEAIDRAVCLYVVPYLQDFNIDPDPIRPLLAAMPRTLKALNA